ncbi:5'-nucleotidase domain-containing protein 2 isoform 2-T2 [Synchiropus picturatus]
MSLRTVASAVWAMGSRPATRSPHLNTLSTSCAVSAGGQHGRGNPKESSRAEATVHSGELPRAREPPGAASPAAKRLAKPGGAPSARTRSLSSTPAPLDQKSYLWARYNDMKRLVHELIPPGACKSLNSSTIYANNEVSLAEVDIYGFDYDYTLAVYSNALNTMIYEAARGFLIEHFKYPAAICKYDYIPNFAVRGLHYDIQKGLLMKIDAFHYIQPGSVYRGLSPVPDDEVLELYGGTYHIPLEQDSGFYGKEAIGMVHLKGFMYKWITQDLDKFILRGGETEAVLHRLVSQGKKLFLITNSPFSFVDKGMTHMVGKDWRDFFDVVIVQADKPHFFTDCIKPFRCLDQNGNLRWEKISSLSKGQVYKQGNLFEFLRLTGWRGSKVLYFGDHLYSDLADLTLRHGWRTAAIVPELEQETKVVSTERYALHLTWLQALTGLMEQLQIHRDPESKEVFLEWQKEREELRVMTKNLFNPQFGSIFRTCHNPTYFSRRLCRFSDVYMASLSCLLNYDPSYTFYPRRTPLQHEAPLWMDQLCTGCMKTPFLEDMSHIR